MHGKNSLPINLSHTLADSFKRFYGLCRGIIKAKIKRAKQKMNERIAKVISGLVERLIEKYKPDRIILYGSYAYGTPHKESDIDLLIVKETKDRPIDRRIAVRRLVSDIRKKVPFSSLVVTPEELSNRLALGDDFFIEITQRGKVLYEK